MKKCLALLAFALFPSVPQAQISAPVIQQVLISGHRGRFDSTTVPPAPAVFRYILIDPGNAVPARDGVAPLERVAVLVLFIGGDGTLGLTPNQVNTGSQNFLARNRHHFAAEGFVVAVVDAANDFNARAAGLRGHRLPGRPLGNRPLGGHHLDDLAALMADLRTRYPGIPVWAVGTSRGTVSAALTAVTVIPDFAAISPPADGLVLTSSLTGPDASEDMDGVALDSVPGPVLIVSHAEDACALTRPADSEALTQRFTASEKVQFKSLDGGSAPLTDACEALAAHGFFGIDQKAVEAITRWIRGREE